MNNDNFIEIYEIKRDKLLREICDLWEADQIIDIKKENRYLKLSLINELGVDSNGLY